MSRNECAGLRVMRNTLDPVRATEIQVIPERGDYRQIESWDGAIAVEVTDACHMSERACLLVAEALANDEMPRAVFVSEWKVERERQIITLVPVKWEECDVESGFRIQ